MNRRILALAAVVAAGFVASCDAPTNPPTVGSIAPRVSYARDDSPRAIQPLTLVRATISGPTSKIVDLTLSGSSWTGQATDLLPGSYSITIEGLVNGQVQHFGSTSGVSVVAGQTANPGVSLVSAVPTITPLAAGNTALFTQNVTFTAVPGATGYTVEASQSSTFASGVIQQTSTNTTVAVAVNDVGTWFLRARPTLPTASQVIWSDPQQFTVIAVTGGVAPASAEAAPVTSTLPDTITGRNLTPAVREGWYSLSARAGDTIIVETRAERLTPASALNTVLTLYQNDGTTEVANNDNIASPATTDSKIVTTAPTTGTYKVKVGASGATVGHYVLILELRRLPAAPTSLTAVATSATATALSWTDNADNETSYRVERCATAGCSTFAEVGNTATGVSTFNDASLTAGESYTYRVRARNAIGNSAYTTNATVVLAGPAAPSALTATTVSGTQIDLAWTDNSSNETGFDVQRCALVTCTDPDFAAVVTVGAGVTTYQNTGLSVDGVYTYRVRAVNAVAPSAFSAVATANTLRPAAPTVLAAVTTSANRIDLGWTDNAANESGFRIERCTGQGCSSFAVIDSTATDVITFADLTTTVENFYSYRVRAYNVAGSSNPTSTASANTRTPGAPASVTATTVSGTSITLAWADTAAAETGFLVERCTGAGCTTFLQIGTAAANATAYNDNAVTIGNTYLYRVRSSGVAGNSAYSPTVTGTTLLPAAPSALAATTISGTQVNLSWTDNSDNETTFRVERCLGAACSSYTEVGFVTAGTTAYSDVGVVTEGVYRYRVTARNAVGNSAYTTVVSASTESSAAPSALTATTFDATRIDLAWTDNSGNETGFRIERCTGAGCTSFVEITTVAAGVTIFQNTGITAGASYSYRVRAYNVVANSAYTNTATATTSAPSAPTGLATATVSATKIGLTWTDASTDEFGFRVERCDLAVCTAGDFVEIGITGVGVATYTDSTVAAASRYEYRVRAYNGIGTSGYTAAVAGDTRAPDDPFILTALTMSGTRIDLSWTDNSSNESGFEIERCTSAGCTPTVTLATVGANVTTYSDLSATVGSEYTYRVRAVNNAGVSGYTNDASANTLLPAAPSGLAATAQSATSIALQWVNNAGDANGFVLQRCTGAGCTNFADIDSTSLGQTTFNDLTVTAGNSYRYQVLARNVAGRSAASTPADANTNVPNAPTTLVAATQSNTRIDLFWTDASSDEIGFYIERCAGAGCVNFVLVDSAGANATSYPNTGLAPSTSYSFRITAHNASGSSAYSNTASATTNLPAIPSGLTATATSTTQIDLAWIDNASDETGVEIERCSGAGCVNFALVTVAPAGSVAYVDGGLTAGATLRYRVRAVNGAGASDYSDVAQATTATPLAPSNASATATSTTSATISWTDESDNETSFQLERCSGAACASFATVATLAAGTVTYNDLALAADTPYSYRVRAVNAVGNSAYSNTANTSTVLPAAPTGLTAQTISAAQINLAWTDNATNESAYLLERCTGAACTDFAAIDSLAASTTTYQNTGLPANTVFRYRVRAVNGAGASAYSNIASAATDVPADPSNLVATASGTTSITIGWTDNANNETDFVVQRCPKASCAEVDFTDLQLIGANVTSYLDGTLAAGDTATYRVKAINLNGESRYSNLATASTTVPLSPASLTATTAGGTRIDLAWTDNAADETGYEIERCSTAGCSTFARIDSLAPNTQAFSDLTVALNGDYTYRVRAINAVGPSSYTGNAAANTILPAPASGLNASTISANQVDLTWTDASNNEFGFRLERCVGDACSDFTTLVSLAADVASYSDGSVVLGETYRYRIFSYNAAGDAAVDGPVGATTMLPADPSSLTGTVVSPTSIQLAWTDAATNEAGFRLERCTGAGCTSFVEITTVPTNTTQYTDAALSTNTFYRYRLRAFNTAGVSAYTTAVAVNTFTPTAPTGLAASMVSGTRVNLTWTDASSNETGFKVERCAGAGCTSFAEIATVGVNATAHQDSTLAFGTDYRFRLLAYNGAGNSAYSSIAESNTNVPLDPTALTAAAQSTTQIALGWTDNANSETGFRIERCAGPGCSDFALLATVGIDVTNYTDSGIAPNTSFSYRVLAYNLGVSGFTNTATATTILPGDPTGATATAVSGTRVDLAWTDNANNEYGYRIERCSGAACSDFAQVASVGPDVTSYSDVSLTNGILYRFRIRAYNGAGNSAYTGEVQATTNVPGIPTALTATTMTANLINLGWTDNATDELGYVIERCTGAGCTDFTVIDSVQTPDANFYGNSGLTASTAYRYRVRAYNASGVSGASNVAAASTNTPADPSALTATTMGATQIDLAWADNADNELGFEIERCTGVGCSGFTPLVSVTAGATGYTDATAVLNTTYGYRVRATNNAGFSNYTLTATANTIVPNDPSALTATTFSSTRIDLTWTDNATNEVSYRVERCAGVGCSAFSEVTSLAAGSTSYSDEGLTPNESYSYRVRAVNVPGSSAYTATATATTAIPSDPSALSATTISATRIDLAWTDNSGNELGFNILRCDLSDCSGVVTPLGSVGANVTAYSDLTVTVGNVYYYRVLAQNAAGTSGSTPSAQGSTLLPNAPTTLSAQIAAPTRIDLAWVDAADNEQRFVIERCTGAGCGTFVAIDSTAAGVTVFSDLTAAAGTYYGYKVRAANAAGSSGFTNSVETATIVPADPTLLTANTISESQATLIWTDNSFNETGFVIERCTGAPCGPFAVVDSVGANVTTYQSADLTLGNVYTFRVAARNPVGTSAGYTNLASASTLLPDKATDLTAVVSAPDRIDLAWTDNANNELGFRIERCSGAGCASFVEIAVVGPDVTAYPNTGLSLNTVYVYRVRPFNIVGPAVYSGEATENTLVPLAPSGVTATAITVNQVDLAWTDNSDNETGFYVEKCLLGSECPTYTAVALLGANVTTYSAATDPGNGYSYRVRAVRTSVGASGFVLSNNVSTVLNAPVMTSAVAYDRNRIDLTWADNSTLETGYQIIACYGVACTPSVFLATLPANTTTYSYSGLASGSSYSWSVRAVSNSTLSALTPAAGIWTPQVMTNGVTITGISDTAQAFRNFVISVPAGTPELRVTMSGGSGDPDLYVRSGLVPTLALWDCRPYVGGTAETCTIQNPTPGDYFISMQGYSAFTDVSLKASLGQRFGYPTAFAASGGWSENYVIGQMITISTPVTITHLGLNTAGGTGGVRIGLYGNAGGAPGGLVTQAAGTISTVGFQEFPATNVNVPAGTYWVMYLFENTITRTWDTGAATVLTTYISQPYANGLPGVIPLSYSQYSTYPANSWARGIP